jgi:citrate synthase
MGPAEPTVQEVADWWSTAIIQSDADSIRFRGYSLVDLMGELSFPELILLLIRGELPHPAEAKLVEATMLGMIDHGPHAPSIAVARMAATCGVPMNGIIASAIGLAGDVHGGVAQQVMDLLISIAGDVDAGLSPDAAAAKHVSKASASGERIPGFGHRWHRDEDPRVPRLLQFVREAMDEGVVAGRFLAVGVAVDRQLAAAKSRRLPMNIDGAAAVVFCELGLDPIFGRGLFVLSRAAGAMVHAHEELQQGRHIKGPIPRSIPNTYTGVPSRPFDASAWRALRGALR